MDRPAKGKVMFAVAMHADMHEHGRDGFEWDVLAIGDTWDEVVGCWKMHAKPTQQDTVVMLRIRDTLDFDVCKVLSTGGFGMTIDGKFLMYDHGGLVLAVSIAIREYTEAVIVTA